MVTTGTEPRGRLGWISPDPHFWFQTKREKFRSVDWTACHMKPLALMLRERLLA